MSVEISQSPTLSEGPTLVGTDSSPRETGGNLPEDPIQGWPRLALLMAKTPDFAAFSRFRELNIKSLLYYQVQLTILRDRLHEQEILDAGEVGSDSDSDIAIDRASYAQRADFLVLDTTSEQFKLVEEIRKVLKEYNEALLQFSQVSALPNPDAYNMKSLRKWLRLGVGGDFKVLGDGNNIWGNYFEEDSRKEPSLSSQFWKLLQTFVLTPPQSEDDLDLVMTRPRIKIDGFTRWVACYLIPFYERWRNLRAERKKTLLKKHAETDPERAENDTVEKPNPPKRKKKKTKKAAARTNEKPRIKQPEDWLPKVEKRPTIETWSESGIMRFTSGVSTVVACLLPVVAITVLSQLSGTRDLLLCLAGFSVVFAVGLIFLTQGTSTRVEIFTATAAFSAVMVVFMSDPIVIVPPGWISEVTSTTTPAPAS